MARKVKNFLPRNDASSILQEHYNERAKQKERFMLPLQVKLKINFPCSDPSSRPHLLIAVFS